MIYRVTLFVTNRKDHAILDQGFHDLNIDHEVNEDDEFSYELKMKPETFIGMIKNQLQEK